MFALPQLYVARVYGDPHSKSRGSANYMILRKSQFKSCDQFGKSLPIMKILKIFKIGFYKLGQKFTRNSLKVLIFF